MNSPILHIQNLCIGYKQSICNPISATVRKGEFIGLAGKNGAGKSTLIKTLIGIQPSFSGEIYIKGENIQNWNHIKRAKEIAVVFSRLDHVPAIPVQELVALGRLPYGNGFSKLNSYELNLMDESLDAVGIAHLKNTLATELSDGQLQMVMIARALVQETDLILMDEPTSHLDIENQFKIFELVDNLASKTGKTFIVASHQIELLIQNSTQLWWMNQGEFHAGFPEQIAYEQEIFDQLSQNSIRFNYQTGNFQFHYPKLKTIGWKGDGSKFAFWTKKALERCGYDLISNSDQEIQIINNQIRLNHHTFDTIEKLMNYLEEN